MKSSFMISATLVVEGSLSSEIFKLQRLRAINTRQTKFSGNLPSVSGLELSGELRAIDLGRSFYNGKLPEEWATHPGLKNVVLLNLENTSVAGPVPSTWTSKTAFNGDNTIININHTKLCFQKYPYEGAFKYTTDLYKIPLCSTGGSEMYVEIQIFGDQGACVDCDKAKQYIQKVVQDVAQYDFLLYSEEPICEKNCSIYLQNITTVAVSGEGPKFGELFFKQSLQDNQKDFSVSHAIPIFIHGRKMDENLQVPYTENKKERNSTNMGLIIAIAILGFVLGVFIVAYMLSKTQRQQKQQMLHYKAGVDLGSVDKQKSSDYIIPITYGRGDVRLSVSEQENLDQSSNLSYGFQDSASTTIQIPQKIQIARRPQLSDLFTRIPGTAPVDINVNIDKDLVLLSQLGCGGFGRVYKAKWHTRQGSEKTVAVKILNKDKLSDTVTQSERGKVFNAFYEEINTMLRLKHPGIVHFYGACLKPPALALLMEYMDGGSLDDYLYLQEEKKIPYEEILAVLHKIASVLCYLHPGILHRDIKPQNILLDRQGNVKLADFGLSQIKSVEGSLTFTNALGTPAYCAPEVWSLQKCMTKSDIYQLGMLAWEMISGEKPWKECTSVGQIVQKVAILKLRPEIPLDCPQFLKQLIQDSWVDDPKLRPTAEQLCRQLEEEQIKLLRQTV